MLAEDSYELIIKNYQLPQILSLKMLIKLQHNTRPRLAPGVRLFWDEVRQQPFLLFPEGTLVLNTTALAILELCDRSKEDLHLRQGVLSDCDSTINERTVSEIITELTTKYPSSNLEEDVHHFLSQLAARGLIKLENKK